MQLTFLGTSCMVPTKQRNVQAIFLKYKTEGILFDCGEGTQRQMNITGIKRSEVTKIFVSHWHGDHISGIIGLLQTIGNIENMPKIKVFGPKNTKEKMMHLLKAVDMDAEACLEINDINAEKAKKIFENDDFIIEAANMDHGVPCIGYSFIEKDRWRIDTAYIRKIGVPDGPHLQPLQKGKSITYKGKKIDAEKAAVLVKGKKLAVIPDTAICQNAVELAENADILVCEATYASQHAEKGEKYKHLTAANAAQIANQANAGKLYLTHFSQRYKNTQEIEEDARTCFDNVVCAQDFMKVVL